MSDPEKLKRMLNELAGAGISDRADLWSRLRLRLKPYRPANRMLGWLTLTAVALIAALFGVLLNLPPRNPFAASTGTPTAAADTTLHSYRGMMLVHLTNIDEVAIKPPRGGDPYVEYQIYVWYQQPDQLRLELYRACNLQPILYSDDGALQVGGQAQFNGPTFERCPHPEWITILNGARKTHIYLTKNWVQYESLSNDVERYGVESLLLQIMALDQLKPSADTSETAVEARYSADDYEQLELRGESEVIGRPVQLLFRRGVLPEEHKPGYLYEGDNRLWLDRDTLIPLAGERLLESNIVVSSWRFQFFEPNVDLDPSLFVYLPGRTQMTYSGVQAAWYELAQQVNFPLYFPLDGILNSLQLLSGENFQVPQFPEYLADQNIVKQDFLYGYDPTRLTSGVTMWQGQDIDHVLESAGFPVDKIAEMSDIDLSSAVDAPMGTLSATITGIDNIRWLSFTKDQTAIVLRVVGAIPTPVVAQFAAAILDSNQPVSVAVPNIPNTPTPIAPVATPIAIPANKVAITIFHNGLQTRSVLKYGDELELTVTYLFVDIDESFAAPVTTPAATTVKAVSTTMTPAIREASTTFRAIFISTGLPEDCPDGFRADSSTPTPMPVSAQAATLTAAMTAYPGISLIPTQAVLGGRCNSETALTIAVSPQDALVLAWTVEAGLPIAVKKVE